MPTPHVRHLAIVLASTLLLSGCQFSRREMSGTSMEPTIKNGQHLTIVKDTDKITHNALVVFEAPPKANCQPNNQCEFVKRVVGVPGDTISLKEGKVVLNGQTLVENYVKDQQDTLPGQYLKDNPEVKLGNDEYFVLGDNRPFSLDSRQFGPVSSQYLVGVVTQ